MRRLARVAGILLAVVAGLAAVLTTNGWLYLSRSVPFPGPRIGAALPLDELSKHDSVAVLAFVVVWAATGVLLGLLARAAGAERLTSALVLALCVALWLYLQTGTAFLIVRQVPAHDAFAAAGNVRAVYFAAVLAGLGGALTGRPRLTVRPRAPLVLAWLVAAVGAVGVLDAILPGRPHTLLASLVPGRAQPLASALVAPLGLALLLTARGLARRKQRAYRLAVGVLAGLTVLSALHGFGYGAVAAALTAVALVARRQDFDAMGDVEARPRLLGRALVFVVVILAYGIGAIWVNRLGADRDFTLGFALTETGEGLTGLTLSGSPHLGDGVGQWFPISVFLLGLTALTSLIASWLAPWRYRLRQEARERQLARDLVAAWGVDTLSPFVLRADKSYFFSEDERAFLAYKVVGGVAIVSGDPIGPAAEFDALLRRFIAFARARDWRVAILGAGERLLDVYRAHGLHALYHGEEAVLETDAFSLDGRAIRKVRQSVHRLGNAGYRCEVIHPSEAAPELRDQLEAIAREWRGSEPNRGFVMALDALFRLEDEDAVFVVGRGPDGAPEGFLHFAVSQAGSALSLSSMPRLRATPNGFNEWLVCETVAWAREHGFARISLNFAPFAALLAPEADLSGVQKLERRALLALKGHFQLDNLLLFNRKFLPGWQPRFVVYQRRRDLPRVGIAALAAEAYLPFSGRNRR